jgi:beta-phosphoglucomutase-like phosphatase (HAD superfamily)
MADTAGPAPESGTSFGGAVLVDMDGTICVSDHLHFDVFKDYLRPHLGYDIDQAFYRTYIHGKHNSALFRGIFPDRFTDEELAAMAIEKESLFCKVSGYNPSC